MNSLEYWKRREEEQLKHNITEEKAYEKEIHRIYADMLDGVQKEIDSFYGKYADKEGITLAEAKKRVSKLDIAAYERKAKKYVKQAALDRKANGGKNDPSSPAFSQQANEEMRLYNLTMKVNRLEMLKANIGLETIKGHSELEKFMAKILHGRTMDELKRQAGILGKTVKNNAKKAHAIVNGSFHSGTFSDRIWQYQDLMRVELGRLLEVGLIQGKNPRAIAKDLKNYWYGPDPKTGGGAEYCMERLMRTELARVQTEAQKQSFIRNGFEMYTFITNGGCCDHCQALNGKHFKVAKMMPGENAPPLHPHCRCSVAAYEDSDEYEAWLDYIANGGTTAEWERMKSRKVAFGNDSAVVQSFRPVVFDENEKIETKYGKLGCTATKAIGYNNDIYISDKLHLKRKQVNYVNSQINKAINHVPTGNGYVMPRIIICDITELPSQTVAAYIADDNTLRISVALTSKGSVLALPKDGACSDNHNSVFVHEMFHWSDAQGYIKTHGNVDGYLQSNIETGRKNIEKLVKSGYNINDISPYASAMLEKKRYDEVWTEYRVKKCFEG